MGSRTFSHPGTSYILRKFWILMTLFCQNTTFTCSYLIKMKKRRYTKILQLSSSSPSQHYRRLQDLSGVQSWISPTSKTRSQSKARLHQRHSVCLSQSSSLPTSFVILVEATQVYFNPAVALCPPNFPWLPKFLESWEAGRENPRVKSATCNPQHSSRGYSLSPSIPFFRCRWDNKSKLFIFQIKCYALLPSYYFRSIVSKTCRKGFLVAQHFFGIYGQQSSHSQTND